MTVADPWYYSTGSHQVMELRFVILKYGYLRGFERDRYFEYVLDSDSLWRRI